MTEDRCNKSPKGTNVIRSPQFEAVNGLHGMMAEFRILKSNEPFALLEGSFNNPKTCLHSLYAL